MHSPRDGAERLCARLALSAAAARPVGGLRPQDRPHAVAIVLGEAHLVARRRERALDLRVRGKLTERSWRGGPGPARHWPSRSSANARLPRAPGVRRNLRRGSPLEHHAELVGLDRAAQGLFLRDELLLVEREQALVERLHAELVLADLHLRVNLVDLSSRIRFLMAAFGISTSSASTRPGAPIRGKSCCDATPCSTKDSFVRTCPCW